MIRFLITTLLVGVVAGYLANTILKKDNSDLKNNLIVGLVGSFVGGLVGMLIGLHASNLIGSILMAVIGAILASYLNEKFIQK